MKLSSATWTTAVIVVSIATIATIATIGAVIRWMIATQDLLWLDELHTSWAVKATFGEVAGRAADGNQSPLFFWLAWIFVQPWGESEFAIRGISWVAGLGVMLVPAWLVWHWTRSSIAAVVVVTLVAFNLQFIYYATEARPYCLIQLLSVIQVALFWRVIDQTFSADVTDTTGKRNSLTPAWTLALVSASLVYVHFTAVWIFAVEFIFLLVLIAIPGRSKSNPDSAQFWQLGTRLLTTAVVAMLLCIPAIMQMFSVFERRGNWEVVSSPVNVLRDQMETFVLSIAIPVVCLAVFLGVQSWFRRGDAVREPDPALGSAQPSTHPTEIHKPTFVLLWAIVPTVCVIFLAAFEIAPVALARYTLVGSVAFPIFTGLMITIVKSSPKRLALAVLIVGTAFWNNPIINIGVRNWEVPILRAENWKAPIDAINADPAKSSHPVFLFSNLIEDVDSIQNQDPRFQRYLLFPIRGMYEVDNSERELISRPTLPVEHFADGDIQTINQQGGAWVLVRGDQEILNEISRELGQRLIDAFGTDAEQIRFNLLETPGSPVYLLSIDW